MSLPLHDALTAAARGAATALSLPIGWEGEVFTPPAGPYLRGRVDYENEQAATCGSGGLTRIDGALELTVAVMSGGGDSEAVALSRRIVGMFPRGLGILCTGGEAVLAAPRAQSPRTDGARITVVVRIPFYALLLQGQ